MVKKNERKHPSDHILNGYELILENLTPEHQQNKNIKFGIAGRRVVELSYFLKVLSKMTEHGPLSCKLENMELTKESRCGLRSCLHFKCNVCGVEQNIFTEDPCDKSRMEINSSALSGVLIVGGGIAHLEEITAAMNMPCMSSKYHNIICDGLFATFMEEMKMAAQEESRLAVQQGAVDVDGVPLITVVGDGSWAACSYRSNFSSLSGVAAIVGYKTKKILYIGVKNKYCTFCDRALKEEKKPQKHNCFKNWGEDRSSSSMEAAIIVEVFCKSKEMYGLQFNTH